MPNKARVITQARRRLRGLLRPRRHAHAVALGFAIGAFFAFMPPPPIGLQMILAALVATVLGAARAPALAATWITNPFTTSFLAASCYTAAVVVLRFLGFAVHNQWPELSRSLAAADSLHWSAISQKIELLRRLDWTILGPYVLGCLLFGAAAGVLSYPILLRLARGRILLRAEKQSRTPTDEPDPRRPANNHGH